MNRLLIRNRFKFNREINDLNQIEFYDVEIYHDIYKILRSLIKKENKTYFKLNNYFFKIFQKKDNFKIYFENIILTYIHKNKLYVKNNNNYFKLDNKLKLLWNKINFYANIRNLSLSLNNDKYFSKNKLTYLANFCIYEKEDYIKYLVKNILNKKLNFNTDVVNYILPFLFDISKLKIYC